MYKRITEVAQGLNNLYPIGANANNITLSDGSILEEALGNVNLAENGSIIDQINNMAQSYGQIYAPIISPNFQGSINLKEDSNTVVSIIPKTGNQAVNVSIQGDLSVSGVSNLGTIKNASWSGDLPITGMITSIGSKKVSDEIPAVSAGIKIADSGIGFTLRDLSSDFTRNDIQEINAIVRTSPFSIHPGYANDNNDSAKLYYRSNGIHSFIIGSNGTGAEIATINNTGLDVNGKITCDSFSSPDTIKKLNISSLSSLVNILTDYDTYPFGEPYCVRLYPIVTAYLKTGDKTIGTSGGFTAPGFIWKSSNENTPNMYLFYFGTGGGYYQSQLKCEKVGSTYKNFSVITRSVVGTALSTKSAPLPNPAT